MRADTKQVTFIEEGRIIIDGVEYKPRWSDSVLGELRKDLDNFMKSIDGRIDSHSEIGEIFKRYFK